MNEIRAVSYLLHPPLLDEAGLALALKSHFGGLSRRSGVDVELALSPKLGRFPVDVELVLFRVIQEAITNVHRHSGSAATRITLALEGTSNTQKIVMSIQDLASAGQEKAPSQDSLCPARQIHPAVKRRGYRKCIREIARPFVSAAHWPTMTSRSATPTETSARTKVFASIRARHRDRWPKVAAAPNAPRHGKLRGRTAGDARDRGEGPSRRESGGRCERGTARSPESDQQWVLCSRRHRRGHMGRRRCVQGQRSLATNAP
jgi:hypothetical protein